MEESKSAFKQHGVYHRNSVPHKFTGWGTNSPVPQSAEIIFEAGSIKEVIKLKEAVIMR